MCFKSNFYWIANYVNCHLHFRFEVRLILWTRISFPNCGSHRVGHIANTHHAMVTRKILPWAWEVRSSSLAWVTSVVFRDPRDVPYFIQATCPQAHICRLLNPFLSIVSGQGPVYDSGRVWNNRKSTILARN